MKKIIIILLSYLLIMSPVKAFADGNASVEVNVVGEFKKGSNIEILVDVKNVDNLYAASIDFKYDTKQLKVESIKPTDYITTNIDNIMELGGEVDKNGDTATYSFTFLGDVDGLNGSGTLVKINAKVLNNNNKLSITEDNMKVKLVQKADGTVKNYDYKFIGYNGVNDSNNDSSNASDSSNGNSSINGGSNNTSGNNGVSGDSSYTGNSNTSGNNSSINEENDNSQDSDNKKINSNKNNNDFSNNSNKENKNDEDKNLDNKDEEKSKEEGSSNSEDDKDDIDKFSNINDNKSEIYKNNIANIVYILIAIGVVGYTYYKFRKNKNRDN